MNEIIDLVYFVHMSVEEIRIDAHHRKDCVSDVISSYWEYHGDSEWFFCAPTMEEAKEALNKRIKEQIKLMNDARKEHGIYL